ncbi:MAG TPA: ATP-binding protein [Tenuifilaceae bacterium]|nr:ATP-binding protein [Tenuifilaceae bacterium]HRX31222.1 ATP-binding protein [Tenuifilaceae bacterium]
MKKTIEFSSKIENINIIEKLIDEISDEIKLHSDLYGKILIAAIEGVNNAIVHGNKLDEKKDVIFSIEATKDKIQIVIKDMGNGFDYENLPDPTTPENIENISGRGVFLMQRLSDSIKFSEQGSKVELNFKV